MSTVKNGVTSVDLRAEKESNNWIMLYVGELDLKVTEDELKQLFAEKGDVTTVKICTSETQESLGYGYINFSSHDDAKYALEALNFTSVHGKEIKLAYSSYQDPCFRNNATANLFVKNLDKSIGDEEFYNMFVKYGDVVSSKIRKDASGESKGFGYVQFEEEECAKKAIQELNGVSIHAKELYVGLFLSKEERQKDDMFTNVYVKKLTDSITEEDLRHHFGRFGPLNSVVVMKDEAGNSKGFGFVDFERPEDASKAVESLNGSLFYGEKLYVARAQKKLEREAELKCVHERTATSSPGMNNLCVKYLDDDVDDDKLKFMFSPFGTITSCKVIFNTRGISKGFGFVTFSTDHEGAKAISEMNGKIVGRKPLYVAVAQKKEDRIARCKAMFSNNLQHTIMPAFAPAPFPPRNQNPRPQIFTRQLPPALLHPPVILNSSMLPPMVQGIRPYQPFTYMLRPMPVPMLLPHPQMLPQMLPRPPMFPGYVMPNAYPHGNTGARPPLVLTETGSSKLSEKRASSSMSDGTGTSASANASFADQRQALGEELFPLVEKQVHEMAPKVTGMLLDLGLTEVALLIDSPRFLEEKIEEAVEALKNASTKDTDF